MLTHVGTLFGSAAEGSSETFSTAGSQAWEVPAGVANIVVRAWGGGGGGAGGSDTSGEGGDGGGGGFIQANLAVTPAEVLTLVVAGGGGSGGSPTSRGGGSSG